MDSIILFLYGLWLKYFNITKIRPIIFLSVSKTQALVPAVHPNNTSSQISTLWNWNCYCFGHRSTVAVDAYSEHLRSIGIRSSYNVGAWRMMPAVPASTANVNIHKNSLSSTIATYFQSSLTCNDTIIISRTSLILLVKWISVGPRYLLSYMGKLYAVNGVMHTSYYILRCFLVFGWGKYVNKIFYMKCIMRSDSMGKPQFN